MGPDHPDLQRENFNPLASPERLLQKAQWTQDILLLMLIVILAAVILIASGVLAGVFTIQETMPVYILLLVIAPAWWGARRGGWRWARFIPAVVCFSMGIYMSTSIGFNSAALFFALAILLSGMLVNRHFHWISVFLSIVSLFVFFGFLHGRDIFLGNLGSLITVSFLLIGISLLQWYYDTHLQSILSDQVLTNRVLSEEINLRRSVEIALRDQEAQLRRLAENTTDLVGEIAPDGTFRYASPSYLTTLGYQPETLVGTNAFDMVHPEDLPIAISNAQGAAESKTPRKVQLRCRHVLGHYVYMEVCGTPIYTDAGQWEGFVLSSRDIHQQKVAEQATRESEAKFRNIINSIPMGIHMYSLQGDGALILTGYNPAADSLLGSDHSTLVGKTIEDAFPSLAGTEIPFQYRKVAHLGTYWNQNQVFYEDNRITGAFEVYAFQVAAEKMVALFMDAMVRVKAAEALQLSEEKFSKAFLTSPDSININRLTDGLYLDINQGFTNLTGYSREDVIGKTSLELDIWADPADRDRLVQGLRQHGVVENLEAKFRFKDGAVKTGLMSARIMDVNKEKCILSVTRDISERIKNEEDLRETHARLEEAYEETLQGWVRALELREHETADHCRRVVELTRLVAKALGIEDEAIDLIKRGALLHDIGKMGVPDNILLKPGPLTADEWVIMRYHPQYAYELLSKIPYLMKSIDIPYCHHEKWDGSGYPRGVAGEEIPISARIFSVIDVYDALLSDRPYRPAWPLREVTGYLMDQKGKHFDPKIVDCFLNVISTNP